MGRMREARTDSMIGGGLGHQSSRRIALGAILVALLGVSGKSVAQSSPGAERPAERIVSMNVCTDQLLLTLADRAQIVSLSYLAFDERSSAMTDAAKGLPANHGQVEEILLMQPDLILASAFSNRASLYLLRKLGYAVLEVGIASSLEDIRANIRTVAQAIGQNSRGEAVVTAFDAKLPGLADKHLAVPRAALYWASGYSAGLGTLANAAAEAAGFRTLGRSAGFAGTVQLPLERLVSAAIDVLIIGRQYEEPALSNEVFRHPALKHRFSAQFTITVPDRLWACGTPFVADAIEILSRFRERASAMLSGKSTGAQM